MNWLEENVATAKATSFQSVEQEPARKVTVTTSSELNPTFDFGPGGTMVMTLEGRNLNG